MKNIDERKAQRFQFLHRVYEISAGNELHFINGPAMGEELGFSGEDTDLVLQYLEGEGLIKYRTMGGGISITHSGVREVERALTRPDLPTQYFPPVVNLIQVEHMTNSQIQQGTTQSTQSLSIAPNELEQVRGFLLELKQELGDLGLAQEGLAEIRAEIATIEAQLISSRPKQGIIVEAGRTIRSILESAVGSLAAAGLLQILPQLWK